MKLKHPNLVNIYDYYVSDEYIYMIMDYCNRGELLDYIIKIKRFCEFDAKIIMSKLFDTLKYLNENGIHHFDIKL